MKRRLMLLLLAACGAPAVPNAGPEGPPAAARLSAAIDRTCLVTPQGALRCWGGNATMPEGLDRGVTSVAVAGNRTLVVKDGTVIDEQGGRPLGDRTDIARVAVGERTTCALTTRGEVVCPDGVPLFQPLPAPATSIVAGDNFGCALLIDQTVRCWGYSPFGGASGSEVASVAQMLPLPAPAKALGADATHACATLLDDSVWCLGTWARISDQDWVTNTEPVAVPPLAGASQWSTSPIHTCTLDAQGAVACWGFDFNGTWQLVTTATPVSIDERATAIAVGDRHACALLESGAVQCWGSNAAGQLDAPQ